MKLFAVPVRAHLFVRMIFYCSYPVLKDIKSRGVNNCPLPPTTLRQNIVLQRSGRRKDLLINWLIHWNPWNTFGFRLTHIHRHSQTRTNTQYKLDNLLENVKREPKEIQIPWNTFGPPRLISRIHAHFIVYIVCLYMRECVCVCMYVCAYVRADAHTYTNAYSQ